MEESQATTVEVIAVVVGRVQGVGFRATVQRHAERLRILGSVRNSQDGSVEICGQGTRQLLELFLKEVEEHSPFARIDHIEIVWRPVVLAMNRFSVVI